MHDVFDGNEGKVGIDVNKNEVAPNSYSDDYVFRSMDMQHEKRMS